MSLSPIADAVLSMPGICEHSEIELAHELMRQHRHCRVHRCAWKQVAYRTLVHCRRIEPPRWSPRERAHRRGVPFPYGSDCYGGQSHSAVPVELFQQVLAGLNELANDPHPNDRSGR